jgi:hypothetical protein
MPNLSATVPPKVICRFEAPYTLDSSKTRQANSGTNWRSVGIAAQVTTLSTVTIDEAVCMDGIIWRVNRLVTGQTI